MRPITVLIKSTCSGNEIAMAAAATPEAKRIAVPMEALPFPAAIVRSNLSILRTRIQKLYNPNKEPRINPAKIRGNPVNAHPRTNNASKKKSTLFCLLWISWSVCIVSRSPEFLFWDRVELVHLPMNRPCK